MSPQNSLENPERRLLGAEQAATYMGVAPPTLKRLIAKGVVNVVQIPGLRRVLIDKQDLDALVESGKLQQAAQSQETAVQVGAAR